MPVVVSGTGVNGGDDMVGKRGRVAAPALAVWLLVLMADAAGWARAALPVYLLAIVVAVAIVLVGARVVAGRGDRMAPQPIPVRVRRQPQRYRVPDHSHSGR
jgi:hypothetical protein